MNDQRRVLTTIVLLLGVGALVVTAHVLPGDAYETVVSDVAGALGLGAAALVLLGVVDPRNAAMFALVLGHGIFIRRLAVGSGMGEGSAEVAYFALQGMVLLAGFAFIALGPRLGLVISGVGWAAALAVLGTGPIGGDDFALGSAELLVLALTTATAIMMFRMLAATVESMRATVLTADHAARLAYVDELTGLPNRRHLRPLLRDAVEGRLSEGRVVIVVFDLDHFKEVNDTHGHDVGDAVLRHTARVCQGVVREDDILGRWGGEEFLILLPGADMQDAEEVAERCRRALVAVDGELGVTASFGITEVAADDTVEDLLSRADRALYDAKRTGRNRIVQAATPFMDPAADPLRRATTRSPTAR